MPAVGTRAPSYGSESWRAVHKHPPSRTRRATKPTTLPMPRRPRSARSPSLGERGRARVCRGTVLHERNLRRVASSTTRLQQPLELTPVPRSHGFPASRPFRVLAVGNVVLASLSRAAFAPPQLSRPTSAPRLQAYARVLLTKHAAFNPLLISRGLRLHQRLKNAVGAFPRQCRIWSPHIYKITALAKPELIPLARSLNVKENRFIPKTTHTH